MIARLTKQKSFLFVIMFVLIMHYIDSHEQLLFKWWACFKKVLRINSIVSRRFHEKKLYWNSVKFCLKMMKFGRCSPLQFKWIHFSTKLMTDHINGFISSAILNMIFCNYQNARIHITHIKRGTNVNINLIHVCNSYQVKTGAFLSHNK